MGEHGGPDGVDLSGPALGAGADGVDREARIGGDKVGEDGAGEYSVWKNDARLYTWGAGGRAAGGKGGAWMAPRCETGGG